MTRKMAIRVLPIIQEFANGADIQYYDSAYLNEKGTRGKWVSSENIGFGNANPSAYRMVTDKGYVYFDGTANQPL